jgi:hypothetical protein
MAISLAMTPQTIEYVAVPEPTAIQVLQSHPELSKIAQCESGMRQFNSDGTVLLGRVNPMDVGILQINLQYHGQRAQELGIDLYTLEGNIEYGFLLYQEQGATPWKWSNPCHHLLDNV